MIVSANETDNFLNEIEKFSYNNAFACRIISLYNCYGPSLAFVDYWLITDDSTHLATGAIARSGTAFILCLTENSNIEEVSSFMRISGCKNILCDYKYRLKLFNAKFSYGAVLMREIPFDDNYEGIDVCTPKIENAYKLILKCSDKNFKTPSFEDFYVDVNHKLRHNATRLCGITEDNHLECITMTVAESTDGAVIGALACNPEKRRKGYGTLLIKYLTNLLVSENKKVFLHRANGVNESFYDRLGFKQTGKWREYYFER